MLALVAEPLLYTALLGLIFMPIEHLFGAKQVRRRELGTDLLFATLGAVITHALLAVLLGGALAFVADASAPIHGLVGGAVRRAGVAGRLLAVGAGLLLFELAGYAYHRAAHAVPWLWRLHAVHHSATRLDWLASFRQHPLEVLLLTAAQNLPLVALGVPLASHVGVVVALKLHTVFVHSRIALPRGRWEDFVAGPRFHHRHHAASMEAANFASVFPILDRLFGTHCDASAARVGLRGHARAGFWKLLLLFVR